jgi:hypothetical protein
VDPQYRGGWTLQRRASKLVMTMQLHRKPIQDEGLKPISRLQGTLLRIWGPADSHDNPLVGTKYDPVRQVQRQHDDLEYRRHRSEERKQRRDLRLHGLPPSERPCAPEHPDEC